MNLVLTHLRPLGDVRPPEDYRFYRVRDGMPGCKDGQPELHLKLGSMPYMVLQADSRAEIMFLVETLTEYAEAMRRWEDRVHEEALAENARRDGEADQQPVVVGGGADGAAGG